MNITKRTEQIFIFISLFLTLLMVWFFLCLFIFDLISKPKCTDQQLHKVISEVEKCRKGYVICPSENVNKILKEVCI